MRFSYYHFSFRCFKCINMPDSSLTQKMKRHVRFVALVGWLNKAKKQWIIMWTVVVNPKLIVTLEVVSNKCHVMLSQCFLHRASVSMPLPTSKGFALFCMASVTQQWLSIFTIMSTLTCSLFESYSGQPCYGFLPLRAHETPCLSWKASCHSEIESSDPCKVWGNWYQTLWAGVNLPHQTNWQHMTCILHWKRKKCMWLLFIYENVHANFWSQISWHRYKQVPCVARELALQLITWHEGGFLEICTYWI